MTNNANGKKSASVLGLAPLQSANSLELVPYSSSRREVTREEKRVIEVFHREELIIDLTGEKGKLGMRKMSEVQQCASDLFGDTTTYMLENRNRVRGTEAEPFVEEFTLRQFQMHARHLLGSLEVVGTNIAVEMHRSLNLPPEQLTFWQKLLGRR